MHKWKIILPGFTAAPPSEVITVQAVFPLHTTTEWVSDAGRAVLKGEFCPSQQFDKVKVATRWAVKG